MDGLNWYLYVGNNPLVYVDPSGLAEEDLTSTTVNEGELLWQSVARLNEQNGTNYTSDEVAENNGFTKNSKGNWEYNTGDSIKMHDWATNNEILDKIGVLANQVKEGSKEAAKELLAQFQNLKDLIFGEDDPELLLQSDGSININDKLIGRYGCYFRSCQSVAELTVGKALTANQILDARKELSGGIKPAIGGNMRVLNPDTIINDAFKRLGNLEYTTTVGWGAEKGQSPAMYINKYNTKWGNHFKLGDSTKKDQFDPDPTVPTLSLGTNYGVFIHKKNK